MSETGPSDAGERGCDIGDQSHRRGPHGGLISFVGAGPGAPDLITLRGAQRLSQADVVVWASSLVPSALLSHVRAGAAVHDSAVMTLEDVLAVYENEPEAATVRLHSGDPSVYGAIQEQIDWCVANGRRWEIVPGVSSLGAAAAVAGRELTVPGVSQSIVLTRLPGRTRVSMPETEALGAFAATGSTMAVFLSGARPEELQRRLLAPPSRYDETTPAVLVARATWPDQLVRHTTVGHLAEDLAAMGITTTVLVLVGDALSARDAPPTSNTRSNLYSPGFAHAHRRRSRPGSTSGRPARGAPDG